jgi:hypothetical protein
MSAHPLSLPYSHYPRYEINLSAHQHKKCIFFSKWYIYIIEYYPAIKKMEILLFVTTWMNPEDVMFI